MAGTRIEFQDLCKTFNTAKKGATITALDNVTLTVEPGEILGVIGYSGAGKSTLVRMINGLDSPTSGALLLDGTNIVGMPEKQLRKLRRNIGMIFQGQLPTLGWSLRRKPQAPFSSQSRWPLN